MEMSERETSRFDSETVTFGAQDADSARASIK